MTTDGAKDLRAIIVDSDLIERALRKAAIQLFSRQKRLGNPIVVWRDGKVLWIPPEEIEVPEENPA